MEREKKYFICLNRMQLTVSELTKPKMHVQHTATNPHLPPRGLSRQLRDSKAKDAS